MNNATPRPDADAAFDALLHQLRQQAPVQPRPFFYARVQARLVAPGPAGPWLPGWARRPAYLLLLGALGLAMSGDGMPMRPAAPDSHYHSLPSQSGPLPR